jgi:hypothetical protein
MTMARERSERLLAKRKTAMVAPPPAKLETLTLEEVLQLAGNTRAYTVICVHGNTWRVHFEGDYARSTVKIVSGKAVIIRDDQ